MRKNIVSINDLNHDEIDRIISLAGDNVRRNRSLDKKLNTLKGLTLINLFFENSTRTRTSFEIAGKRLGADVINISPSNSSMIKGENIIDTAKTLDAMNPEFLVIRHGNSGAAQLIAKHVKCSVINAGDGMHEHPTQALLDLLTIKLNIKSNIQDLKIAICGDVLHSRVARSSIMLLKRLGADIRVVASPHFLALFC